jgi:hypothetical protein
MMIRMGYLPTNADVSKVASATRVLAITQAFNAVLRGGPRDHERGRDFSLVAKITSDILESVGSPEEDLKNQLSSMMLMTDEQAQVVNINELSDGRHTVDLQPTGEKEHAK